MNLPNKLSIARALCIPVIVVLLYMNDDACRIAAGIPFILAALTDLLDGKIARKYNLITDFGKFIDPVADKLLVLTTLVMLVRGGLMEAWVVVIILCRELAVDGLRMVAVGQGKVIAAGPLGKWKTTFQMVTIVCILLLNKACFATWYTGVLTGISVVLTLVSAVDYFVRNRSVFAAKSVENPVSGPGILPDFPAEARRAPRTKVRKRRNSAFPHGISTGRSIFPLFLHRYFHRQDPCGTKAFPPFPQFPQVLLLLRI